MEICKKDIVIIVAAKITGRKYSPCGAHSMTTKRDIILRGNHFCKKYNKYVNTLIS